MRKVKPQLLLLLLAVSLPSLAADQWLAVELSIQPSYRSFDGQVEAIKQATVSSQTRGRVAEIHYDVDDYVPAGSVLIEFTNTEQKQALKSAQANFESAKATEKEAIASYNRVKSTFDRKLIAQSDLDLAISKKNTASAAVKAQQAALETATTQLEYTLIKAPFDGIVTTRHVEKGETVDVGMPVMSGLSLDHLRVIAHVPESMIGHIDQNSAAQISLPNQQVIQSTDLTLFPYADPVTRTFELRVNLPVQTTGLFPGMSSEVSINTGSEEMILIPETAIIRRGELTLVYTKHENKHLPRQIKTGKTINQFVEVISGLQPGDLIMTNPLSTDSAAQPQSP